MKILTLIPFIPTPVPRISTPIRYMPNLIPPIPTLISHIPIIPFILFPIYPFQLLWFYNKRISQNLSLMTAL